MATIEESLRKCLLGIIQDMSTNMGTHKRNASGKSVASLTPQIISGATVIEGVLTGNKSWLYMEKGRPPGKTPKGFVKIIRQWIIDKGISVKPKPYKQPSRGKGFSPQERGLKSLAGAIAHKIKTSGTRLHRSGTPEDIYSTSLERRLQILLQDLDTCLDVEINKITDQLTTT